MVVWGWTINSRTKVDNNGGNLNMLNTFNVKGTTRIVKMLIHFGEEISGVDINYGAYEVVFVNNHREEYDC